MNVLQDNISIPSSADLFIMTGSGIESRTLTLTDFNDYITRVKKGYADEMNRIISEFPEIKAPSHSMEMSESEVVLIKKSVESKLGMRLN